MDARATHTECQVLQDGSEVNVIDDEELGSTVVELVGPQAALVFQCGAILRYLVLHIKNLDRFLTIEVEVVDDSELKQEWVTGRLMLVHVLPDGERGEAVMKPLHPHMRQEFLRSEANQDTDPYQDFSS